jgi:hypothetical protein
MKVVQTSEQILIKENPGCLWISALFFGSFGALFIYGALNGFYFFGIDSPWAVSLTFVLGALGIVLGLWIIYQTPISHLLIDKRENVVELIRYGIFGKHTVAYDLAEIERFCLIETLHPPDASRWSFGFALLTGEKVPVTPLGFQTEDYENKFVYPLNVFSGKELPACRLNFGTDGESDDEMS